MKKKDNSNREEIPKPDPEFIAQQLRKPSGEFAAEIAEAMNRVNHPLSELTLENMNVADGDRIMEIGFAGSIPGTQNGRSLLYRVQAQEEYAAISVCETRIYPLRCGGLGCYFRENRIYRYRNCPPDRSRNGK